MKTLGEGFFEDHSKDQTATFGWVTAAVLVRAGGCDSGIRAQVAMLLFSIVLLDFLKRWNPHGLKP